MAIAGTKVGSGYVTIEPDWTGFQPAVERSIKSRFQKIGDDAGRTLTNSVSKRVRRDRSDFGLAASLAPIVNRFKKTGDDAGRAFSKGVSKGAPSELNSIARAMQKAGVDFERSAGSSAKAMRSLERDTFGVGRAAKKAGADLLAERRAVAAVGQETRSAGRDTAGLTGRLRSLGAELRASRRDARAAGGGFRGFDGGMARVNRSAQFFRNILRLIKWPAIIAGVGLFAQGLSALAAGFVATTSAVGPLAGGLVALPSLALAGAQAFSVLKLATAGVGDAVKAALAAEVKGGSQAVDTLRQQEAAAERVADAKRGLADTQRQALIAQEDLTEARQAATRELQDMRLAAEASHDSEQQGRLSLIQARRDLAQTLRDPSASGLDIRFAEEAVDQAKRDLEQTRIDAKRARQDYQDAQKKGVDGMPEVVAAKRAEEDADRAVADAQRDLAKAVRENSDAMKDQGGAATALQEKMSQLPQAGQKFVRFLVGLKPRLDALRDTAASGFFPGAEKGLRGSLRNFGVLRKLVDGTSKSLGRLASKAGRKLGSEAWGKDLGRLGKLNERIIGRLGDSTLNLADAFRSVLVSAEPFLDWLSKGTEKFSELLKTESAAGRESGRIAAFFDRTKQTMERLLPILKGVGGGLLNVGSAARPMGNQILDALGDAAEGWRKWTDSVSGQNRLQQYFKETKPAIFEMGRLIRDAGKAFFELGKQKGVAHLLRLVRTGLIPAMRDLVGGTTGFASSFLKQFQRLRRQGAGTFDAFVQTLVEHSAEAGIRIAEALVKAFINAGIWGKLATGAFIVSKFGGLSAFDRFGKGAGRKFATGFLLAVLGTELAKEIKKIVEGHELDAPKSEKFADYVKEYFQVDTAKIVAPNRVKITTALGSLLFNSRTEEVIRAQGKKLQRFVGMVPSQIVTEFDRLRALPDKLRSNFQPLPGIAGQAGKSVNRALLPKLDELVSAGKRKSEDFKNKVGGQFTGLAKISIQAMESIGISVSNLLDAMNLKKPKGFNVQKALKEMPELKSLPERQAGGYVRKALRSGGLAAKVPGTSTGDRHLLSLNGQPVAKVESREGIFVGNRNYMSALERGNKEVPRFQKGGMAKRAGGLVEPHIAGPDGPLKRIGQEAVKKVYEGAKSVLSKAAPEGGGGSIANAGPLSRFNRPYPEHMLSNVAGKARFSESLVERIMRWAGLPGRLFAQVTHGESDNYPGVYGIDPGGTEGLGLLQITTGFNDARIRKWGGRKQMFNPLKNAKAGKEIYDEQGLGAWYGLKFVTGMMKGGPLKAATGAEKDGNPFLPEVMRGGAASAPAVLSGPGGFLPKTIGRIKAKAQQIASAFTGYVWGGGHGEGTNVLANGLDCSGAVAKLVQQSGWTDFAVAHSSEYARRFHPGAGDLFTLWSNNEHTFAEIEGREWGTNTSNGLGYHSHTTAGFTPSHPALAPEGGGATGATAAPPKENIPATFKGAKTGALNFGPMPKNLEGVNKQLTHWEKKAGVYRSAKAEAAKAGRPGLAQAIAANLEKIEARISGLRKLRTRLRLEETKKAIKKRLNKAFGRFGTYEQIIEGSQRSYEVASEFAEHVVDVEPLPPELGPDATDGERAAAEKAYVENFKQHVEGQERPAYAAVVERLADWRNNILRAERFGFKKGESGFKANAPSVLASSTAWEKIVRQARARIDHIQTFSKKVDDRVADFKRKHPKEELPDGLKKQVAEANQMKKELPALRLKDGQFTGAVEKARGLFFEETKNRIKPPSIPLPWSGTLEEALTDVQGLHPEASAHGVLGAADLAGPPTPGRFGGIIWDLQETIKGLGLKVQQAFSGIAGSSGEGSDEDSELVSILREIAEREHKGRLVSERLASTASLFNSTYGDLPKFHSGGVTPGPAGREFPALLKGHETVRTAEQEVGLISAIQGVAGGQGGGDLLVEVNVLGEIYSEHPDPVEVVIRDPRTKRTIQRTRGGRQTAGGARR